MEIIDNFNLSLRHDPQFTPWLMRVLERVKRLSRREGVVRLSADYEDHSEVRYQLYNSQGKTYVSLFRRGGQVILSLFQRNTPDPERGFKPELTKPVDCEMELRSSSIDAAAAMIQKHLDQDTPYARGTVTRIRVTPTAKVIEPWTFCGGRVTALYNTHADVRIEVDHGKNVFFIPHEKMAGHRPGVMKYIVFNEFGEFAFIVSSEFHIYFEMVK